MGMVSRHHAVVGVPLPFMSFGGTALVTLCTGLGILMSIHPPHAGEEMSVRRLGWPRCRRARRPDARCLRGRRRCRRILHRNRSGRRRKAPTKKPAVALKRGGGYYKDDGPADEIPDGLDDVPDAEPRIEPLHRFANRPYVVFGREYAEPPASGRTRNVASAAGTARNFMARKPRSANPTTCSP